VEDARFYHPTSGSIAGGNGPRLFVASARRMVQMQQRKTPPTGVNRQAGFPALGSGLEVSVTWAAKRLASVLSKGNPAVLRVLRRGSGSFVRKGDTEEPPGQRDWRLRIPMNTVGRPDCDGHALSHLANDVMLKRVTLK
jgi:hypothetical protein